MKIQFGHSRMYNYKKELYEPIKKSHLLQKHTIILPHDENNLGINSKETLKNIDIFFAEVSYPSTGLGIELGFAKNYGTRIICFNKEGTKTTGALKYICNDFFEYTNIEEMIKKISEKINIHEKLI